jgi:hypothetical protein
MNSTANSLSACRYPQPARLLITKGAHAQGQGSMQVILGISRSLGILATSKIPAMASVSAWATFGFWSSVQTGGFSPAGY